MSSLARGAYADEVSLARLEARILDYVPAWERSVDGRGMRGYAQYVLLSAFNEKRLTSTGLATVGTASEVQSASPRPTADHRGVRRPTYSAGQGFKDVRRAVAFSD